MKIFTFVAILLLAVFQAGFAEGQKENQSSMSSDNSMTSKDTMTGDNSMTGPTMEGSNGMTAPAPAGFYDTNGLAPYVVPYTTEAAAQALAAKGPTVYYFAASWCPTCQATMKDIRAHYKNLTATIVLVNYDTATALKTRYGITAQHSFVQIDKNGKALAVWAETPTVAQIDSHVVMN